MTQSTPVTVNIEGNIAWITIDYPPVNATGTAVRIGLPKVNVGLISGAGGSQRLPRLIGMEEAIDVACSGKILSADELLKLGGIDLIVNGDLREAAIAFAANIPERPLAVSLREVPKFGNTLIESKRRAITARAKGQHSPLHNLAAMLWSALPFKDGQPLERALRYAFFAERAVGKPTAIAGASVRTINEVTIVGGGLMGAGIAQQC